MKLYNKLKNQNERVAIIGLGYVGLPLAIEAARHFSTVGFDIHKEKISQ